MFPSLLNRLYQTQTPFHKNLLVFIKKASRERAAAASVAPSTSASISTAQVDPSSSQKSNPPSSPIDRAGNTNLARQQTAAAAKPTQDAFKTLGQATKSPTVTEASNQLSNMPSDFEHIFHYSETQ